MFATNTKTKKKHRKNEREIVHVFFCVLQLKLKEIHETDEKCDNPFETRSVISVLDIMHSVEYLLLFLFFY